MRGDNQPTRGHILVIEDNPSDQRLIEEAFAEAGSEIEFHWIESGGRAIELLREVTTNGSPSLPGLVMTDFNLSGGNGDELVEAIRTELALISLPVIMLTRSDDPENIARCYEAGANAYLHKPNEFDEWVSLAQTVEQFWFFHAGHVQIVPGD